jgi:2-iminobutanoate/2-iminopropanoate deaminase
MMKIHNPRTIAPPIGTYSNGIEVPPNARWLHIAGQVAVRKDGTVPATIAEQTVVAWDNVTAILASAGMKITDIVKVTQYLTDPAHFSGYVGARARFLGDHRPASTVVMISALVKPEFLVEVEAVAAKAVTALKPAKRARRAGVKTRKRAAVRRRR